MEAKEKVFYDDLGKLYKGLQPTSDSHMEMNQPTPDILKALDDVAVTREEMIARINHPDFNKIDAVLAVDEKAEITQGGQ